IKHVEDSGSTLLWTGPLGLDEYWQPTNRLKEKVGPYTLSNVLREEMLEVNGHHYPVSFGQRRIAQINKDVLADASTSASILKKVTVGKGTLIWCPLPIELNERSEVMKAVYQEALSHAQVEKEIEWIQGGEFPGI